MVKKSLRKTFSSPYTKKSLETNTASFGLMKPELIYTAVPLLLDFPKRRRANRKVFSLEMPSARFIGERVVDVASFINKVFFSGTYAIYLDSYGEKRKPLHYIHRQDEPTLLLARVALFSFHTLSHKTTVATSLTSRRITFAGGRGGCLE